ncbi:hypothetical protein Taro_006202 [Colocasia esculenta]|uniref:Uncharacterized protein n=1 Tax=Colocasia esculenta TaxID=4460 RepID=A0A843TS37_COLES|nr:hypothetical protein [Colocasia esculenta]
MIEHPYQRPGVEISRRVEHDFRSPCPYAIASTASDHTPGEEFYAGPEISECDLLPTGSKCRF